MLAIWKRELKSLFWGVTGWIFIGINLAIFGLYFLVYNLMMGNPYVTYSLSSMSFVFLVTVPVLTMKLLAEERKNKTDQLILTAPISVLKIVLGKFLALAVVYSIVVAVIMVAPIVLSIYGEVPLLENYIAILGFWLFGLTCLGIGLFVSSLTENQMIAAVVTFLALFLGYMMTGITNVISSSGNLLTKILNGYNLLQPMESMMNGTLSLSSVVYYLSLIVIFLVFTMESIEKRRWTVSKKNITLSAFSLGLIVVVLAASIGGNLLLGVVPEKYTKFDVTKEKLFTISKETKEFLKGIEEEVTIYVLATKGNCDEILKNTLTSYEEGSKKIKIQYVDLSKQPDFASQYGLSELEENSIIVASAKRQKGISYSNIYISEVDYSTGTQQVTGYDGEGQLTSAIDYVTSNDMPICYQLTGHGETMFSGSFLTVLEKANMEVRTLNLLETSMVPDDCELLMINGPVSDLSQDDVTYLKNYLAQGKNLFITLNKVGAQAQDMTRWNQFLKEYGFEATEGLVGESNTGYYYQSSYFLLPEVIDSSVSDGLLQQFAVFAPLAVGIKVSDDISELGEVYLQTSDQAIANVGYQQEQELTMSSEDEKGQFILGGCWNISTGSNVAVFGSYEMFTDQASQYVSGRNANLFANVIRQMTGEEKESSIVIPVKNYSVSQIMVSTGLIIFYGILFSIILPLVVIIVGIIIWAKRRRK